VNGAERMPRTKATGMNLDADIYDIPTPNSLWCRAKGEDGKRESVLWYTRFKIYLNMENRSVRKAFDKWTIKEAKKAGIILDPTKIKAPHHKWYTIAKKWRWEDRASAYDLMLAEEDEKRWVKRRNKVKDLEWDRAAKIDEIVEETLEKEAHTFITSKKRFEKGKPTIKDENGKILEKGTPSKEILILGYDAKAVVTMSKHAAKLRRDATGLATETIAHRYVDELEEHQITEWLLENKVRIDDGKEEE